MKQVMVGGGGNYNFCHKSGSILVLTLKLVVVVSVWDGFSLKMVVVNSFWP